LRKFPVIVIAVIEIETGQPCLPGNQGIANAPVAVKEAA